MTPYPEHGADRVSCETCAGRGYHVIPCGCGCRGKLDGFDGQPCCDCEGRGWVELERESPPAHARR